MGKILQDWIRKGIKATRAMYKIVENSNILLCCIDLLGYIIRRIAGPFVDVIRQLLRAICCHLWLTAASFFSTRLGHCKTSRSDGKVFENSQKVSLPTYWTTVQTSWTLSFLSWSVDDFNSNFKLTCICHCTQFSML